MTRQKCFAFASQPSCLIGTLKDLAPMLRGYPLSIGVIPGIDRANSFSTHPPYFYGMLGLFVPPALPTLGIVLKLGFSSAWCSGHQLVFDGHVPLSQCRHRGTQRAECRNICVQDTAPKEAVVTIHKCFASASQLSFLAGTSEILAPMLRRFPLSIGAIPGIDRAISFIVWCKIRKWFENWTS